MVDLDSFACMDCGLEAVLGGSGRALHVEVPPEGWKEHDVTNLGTRRDYLLAQESRDRKLSPAERTALATERLAVAVERIAQTLESR